MLAQAIDHQMLVRTRRQKRVQLLLLQTRTEIPDDKMVE